MNLTKKGLGTQVLTGTNSYTGTTTVSGGTLALDIVSGGSLSSSTSLSLGSGGNFRIDGASSPTAPGAVTLVGITTTALTNAAVGMNMLTLNGGVNISASTLTSGGLTLVRGNRLGLDAVGTAGSTNVTFSTTPTLVGSGSAGTSTVGVVANMIGDTAASGSGSGFLTYDAATGLRLLTGSEQTGTLTAGSNVKIAGTTASAAVTVNSLEIAGGSITGTSAITISNNILLVSGASTSSTATINRSSTSSDFYIVANSDFTTTGAINNGGSATSIYKFGSGTVSIGGSNDGGFVVEEGVLAASSGTNKVRGITVNGGTFKFMANNMQIGGQGLTINSGGTADFNGKTGTDIILNGAGTVTNSDGTAGTLAVRSGTFTGSITDNLNVNKLTAGTLMLSGTNSYTGTTTVSAGTLLVSGELTGTSSLAVSGGTLQLGAENALNDAATLTLSGGIFSTGATTGFNETLATLDLNTAASITLSLGTGIHSLNFADSSAIDWTGSTLTINGWTGTAGSAGTSGRIFFGGSATGLTTAQLSQINFTGYSDGAAILSSGEIVAVPEPATWALLAFSLTTVLVIRRRRA